MQLEITVPIDINLIKLGDYQKFNKIAESEEDIEDGYLDIRMLEIFCKIPYNVIQDTPVGNFDKALVILSETFNSPTPLVRRFTIKGKDGVNLDLGFIPNLDKMSIGEYIDLNKYFEDTDNLHRAMAVLFRPVHSSWKGKDSYRIAKYEGTEIMAEIMKDMPLGIALGAKVFFYRLGMKLSRYTLSYSKSLLTQTGITISEEQKQILVKNMDGINSFMLSQEEMLSKSIMPRCFRYTKR